MAIYTTEKLMAQIGGASKEIKMLTDASLWHHHAGLIEVKTPTGIGYAGYGYQDDNRVLVGGPTVRVKGIEYPILEKPYHYHELSSPTHLIADNKYGLLRFRVNVPRGAWSSIWAGDCNLYIAAKVGYTLQSNKGYYAELGCDNVTVKPASAYVSAFWYEAGYFLPPGPHAIFFDLHPIGHTAPTALDFQTTVF